jgi:hypothetical protein
MSSQVATIIVDSKKGIITNIITHVDELQKDLFKSMLEEA